MNKTAISILMLITSISLSACGSISPKHSMYIEEAQLSKQEESMAQLLGANGGKAIYDFTLDDDVKSIEVNTYQLVNGSWNQISGGSHAFTEKKGRMALEFLNVAESLRVSLQSRNGYDSIERASVSETDFTGMSSAASFLGKQKEITYDQEIPLIIQITTSNPAISSYDVESFYEPEAYENQGYEYVYAVTVRFSRQSLEGMKQ